jgi:hypothetical protein
VAGAGIQVAAEGAAGLIMRPKPSKRPEKARGMASRDVLRRGMGAP